MAAFYLISLALGVLLVSMRGSSVDPEPVADSLRAGGAGLKIHEDVAKAVLEGARPQQHYITYSWSPW